MSALFSGGALFFQVKKELQTQDIPAVVERKDNTLVFKFEIPKKEGEDKEYAYVSIKLKKE